MAPAADQSAKLECRPAPASQESYCPAELPLPQIASVGSVEQDHGHLRRTLAHESAELCHPAPNLPARDQDREAETGDAPRVEDWGGDSAEFACPTAMGCRIALHAHMLEDRREFTFRTAGGTTNPRQDPGEHVRPGAAAFAAERPASQAGHLGGQAGLIDEDKPLGIEIRLPVEPVLAPLQDVRAFLLQCVCGLFLNVQPRPPSHALSALRPI